MQALQISGVDSSYVLVTKREKDLSDGTYRYTCVKAPSTEFAYNGKGIVTSVDIPFDPTAFTTSINRVLALTADGTPKDSAPIRVYIDSAYDYPTVSATYNGTSYSVLNDDGRLYVDIPVTAISSDHSGSITSTYNDFTTTKEFKIGVVKDGTNGAKGDKGDQGETGTNGTNGAYNEYQFAKSTSPTTAPTTGWQDTPMDVYSGEYLWMRQRRVTF